MAAILGKCDLGSGGAGLPDLGIYPKIHGNFLRLWDFAWYLFFRKALGINIGNCRNCSVKFFVFVSIV